MLFIKFTFKPIGLNYIIYFDTFQIFEKPLLMYGNIDYFFYC